MNLVIVCDSFLPTITSASIQLNDLALALASQGHDVWIITVSEDNFFFPQRPIDSDLIPVLRAGNRLKTSKIKKLRFMGEIAMPYIMLLGYHLLWKFTPKYDVDGIICYSPSIFHTPFVKFLKARAQCPSVLILRDLFPEWARDLGLIRNNLILKFFKSKALAQFHVHDQIMPQSLADMHYIADYYHLPSEKLSHLTNWLGNAPLKANPCDLEIVTNWVGKEARLFVYAGNMGKAQNILALLNAIEKASIFSKLKLLFVGRGDQFGEISEFEKQYPQVVKCMNILDQDELETILYLSHAGLIVLDRRLSTHNLPGKMLTYLRAGLPILAFPNRDNELDEIINKSEVGYSSPECNYEEVFERALSANLNEWKILRENCKNLFEREYKAEGAASKIIKVFENMNS